MNSYKLIEVSGVLLIVFAQAYYFWRTRQKIAVLSAIFPKADHFEVNHYMFLKEDLRTDPRKILDDLDLYIERAKSGEFLTDQGYGDVELLTQKSHPQQVTAEIVRNINTYLLRNRGAASDFHLIKDIVDGRCDIVEDEITQTISQPLYLGLLGTFMGIVFGLLQLSGMQFSANSSQLDQAITFLLGGVSISMIASFMGLLLTLLNSAYGFTAAKRTLQYNRDEFFTFIKTELLPLLNQNINTTLFSLQTNLHRFNENFGSQIGRLDKIMDRNYETLMAQDRILTTIDHMDVTSYAKANVKVLSELRITTEQLVNFNVSLEAMNGLIGQTQVLSRDVAAFTQNTDSLADLGRDIHSVFKENKMLQEFLKQHYSALDTSHQLISGSVNKVYNTLDEGLDNLKEFTMEKIAEIRKLSLQEIDHLENKYPDKWNQLDNLSYLSSLSDSVNDFKEQQANKVGGSLKEIGHTLDHLTNTLEEMKRRQEMDLLERLWFWLTGKKRKGK